ncbi:glycosyltransferase family 2 protein [uncultured Vibrio sp.]|uniref:glycosyltransferase family 2 protein n=1 Tax=uncultured Vibrio sp. TaxID=114054 RepID=UPI0009179D5B|nr:glycosyltransferase family 2 protein [uncultured Vibrio sp.]OIQ25369.1 MAG: hypothetical protein BM561_06290 [Vibrio sp. MedPE-SWchi]
MQKSIDIVLATYNGERYLKEQIESIQSNQQYDMLVDRLIVVDDGSTDGTKQIVSAMAQVDDRIEWHLNQSGTRGTAANFSFGLTLSTAPYLFLCDQDDVWLQHKITTSHSALLALENNDQNEPALVFSDKNIVDDSLKLLCSSYFKLKRIDYSWHKTFSQLLQQNVASGCTMHFNQALLSQSIPMPKKAYMHDWWLVLMASQYGKIELIPEPLILYRQHDKNVVGAKANSIFSRVFRARAGWTGFKKSFQKIQDQASALSLYKDGIESDNLTLKALVEFYHLSRRQRLGAINNKILTRSNFIGRCALFVLALMTPVEHKAD